MSQLPVAGCIKNERKKEKTFHPDSTHLHLGVLSMFFSAPFWDLDSGKKSVYLSSQQNLNREFFCIQVVSSKS